MVGQSNSGGQRAVCGGKEAAEDSGTCRGVDEVGGLGVQEAEKSENFSFLILSL